MKTFMTYNWKSTAVLHSLLVTTFVALSCVSNAQQVELTEEAAITAAIQFHPSIRAAEKKTSAQQALERSAFQLDNPALSLQSPTGEFYTVGATQNFDFPTVYHRQKKVLVAETELAQKQELLTQQEVQRRAAMLYIAAKFAATQLYYLEIQDSILQLLRSNALRQFDAGEINFMEKSFAELQYGEVHSQLLKAQNENTQALQAVQLFCGIDGNVTVPQWKVDELNGLLLSGPYIPAMENSAWMNVAKGQSEVAQRQLSLEKSRALPGLQVGYMNQSTRDTPLGMRWQAGITLPLWFWQYSGKIKSARIMADAASENEKSMALEYAIALQERQSQVLSSSQELNYYLQSALKQADDLSSSSQRFFDAGEIDYITHLRTLNDALKVKFNFAMAAKTYFQSLRELKFITGSN